MQGSELKALRKEAGLSQAQLAAAIGVSTTWVGQMERDLVPIESRTEAVVEALLRERVDVSYSKALEKWTVAVTHPASSVPGRVHHVLAAKPSKGEALRTAQAELKRNPFAKIIVNHEGPSEGPAIA